MKRILFITITLLYGIAVQAQLGGFFLHGDTSSFHPTTGITAELDVVPHGGTPPYTYEWETEPATNAIDADTVTVYFKIKDAENDSIEIKHVYLKDLTFLSLVEHNSQKHTFTGLDYEFDLNYSFYFSTNEDYTIEVNGSAAPYISVINDAYVFNCDQVGEFSVEFVVKHKGEAFTSYSRTIIVGDSVKGAVMVQEKEANFSKIIFPDIRFMSDDVSGTIYFSSPTATIFPGEVLNFTVEDGEIVYPVFQVPFIVAPSLLDTSHTVTAHIQLDSGESFDIERGVTYKENLELPISERSMCVNDTIRIPVYFDNLTEGLELESYNFWFQYSDNLKPINITTGDRQHALKVQAEFEDKGVINVHSWEDQWADFLGYEYQTNTFTEEDTLFYIDFVKTKAGEDTLQLFFDLFDLEGNIKSESGFGLIKSTTSELALPSIAEESILGLSTIISLAPSPINEQFEYKWIDEGITYTQNDYQIDIKDEAKTISLVTTDDLGCRYTTLHTTEKNTDNLYSISGVLRTSNQEKLQGELIAYQVIDGMYYPSAKAQTESDGSYTIEGLMIGSYVILGVPDDNLYNASYYYGEYLQDQANSIQVNNHIIDVDLVVEAKQDLGDEVFSGTFENDSLFESHKSVFEQFHGTLPSIVFLSNSDGELINTVSFQNDFIISGSDEGEYIASYNGISKIQTQNFVISGTNDMPSYLNEVYPNPFNDEVNVNLVDYSTIDVLSTQGILVESFEGTTGTNQIDLSNLTSGAYILLITTNGKPAYVHLLKE